MTLLDNEDALDFGPLPPAIDALLQAGVAAHFTDPEQAEARFREAIALAPDILPAHRCLFKHYNRRRQFAAAHAAAGAWLAAASRQAGLADDWRGWTDAPGYALAALKGLAFILLRLGRRDEAAAALDVLLRLDPEDGVGGSVVAALLPEAEAT